MITRVCGWYSCKRPAVTGGRCEIHWPRAKAAHYRDQEIRKARGVCRNCSNPRTPKSKQFCALCLEKHRISCNRRYQPRRKERICTICKLPVIDETRNKIHLECKPERYRRFLQYLAARAKDAESKGLCNRCCTREPLTGTKYCQFCKDRVTRQNNARIKFLRAFKKCRDCGGLIGERQGTRCAECHAKRNSQGRLAEPLRSIKEEVFSGNEE